MTAHDTWLNIGSDGPADLDEEAIVSAFEAVAESDEMPSFIETVYNAYPALAYAMRNLDFPPEHRAEIAALVNLAADLRAKVDDEYAARAANYEESDDE